MKEEIYVINKVNLDKIRNHDRKDFIISKLNHLFSALNNELALIYPNLITKEYFKYDLYELPNSLGDTSIGALGEKAFIDEATVIFNVTIDEMRLIYKIFDYEK